MALIGMRNVRDYKADTNGERPGSASPFNIARAFSMRDFSRDEVGRLVGQYTSDTGHAFDVAAVDRLWAHTAGQPWLVNALARECVEEIAPGRDVVDADVDGAAALIVDRRETHLDSLAEAYACDLGNAGGRVEREHHVGWNRLDLRLDYRGTVLAIEVKVWRPGGGDPRDEGLGQLDGYLAGLGLDFGWLVIVDRRPDQPPLAERLASEHATTGAGRRVLVVRA